MARRAVIGDGLAIGAGMTAVMTAETARGVIVPKIIRVNTPGHAHLGKDVAKVDRCHLAARLLHERAPRLVDLRVIRAIETVEFGGDALPRHVAGGIINLENLDRLLPDERQL